MRVIVGGAVDKQTDDNVLTLLEYMLGVFETGNLIVVLWSRSDKLLVVGMLIAEEPNGWCV